MGNGETGSFSSTTKSSTSYQSLNTPVHSTDSARTLSVAVTPPVVPVVVPKSGLKITCIALSFKGYWYTGDSSKNSALLGFVIESLKYPGTPAVSALNTSVSSVPSPSLSAWKTSI